MCPHLPLIMALIVDTNFQKNTDKKGKSLGHRKEKIGLTFCSRPDQRESLRWNTTSVTSIQDRLGYPLRASRSMSSPCTAQRLIGEFSLIYCRDISREIWRLDPQSKGQNIWGKFRIFSIEIFRACRKSGVRKTVDSKRVVLAGVPLY